MRLAKRFIGRRAARDAALTGDLPTMRIPLLRVSGCVGIGVAALLATGCNNSMTDHTANTTTQSATGVWSGTDSVSGLGVRAIINSGGQAVFIRGDGIQFTGAAQVSTGTLAITVDGYPDFSSTFSDGSDYGIGTLSGTVTTGASLTGSLSFTTNGNSSITGNWSLTYEALSNTASSTTAISGNYPDGVTGTTISISTTGGMSGQNGSNSCTLTGSVSTTDSTHNVYEVAYSYAGCTGTYAAVNGVQFTGLATLNSSVSPALLIMTAAGTSGAGVPYGIVSSLNGS
jgi:hypothetical protein